MDQKLRFYFLLFFVLSVTSVAFSQANSSPFSLPTSITVGVVDPANFKFNTDTNSYPVSDLIKNTYGNSSGVSLIYPDMDVLVTQMQALTINGAPSPGGPPVTVILQMPFETYVKGVVRAETFPTWNQLEVFKTEAVAARSYAVGFAVPYKAEVPVTATSGQVYNYDTIGNTDDQVFISYVPSLAGWDGDDERSEGIAGQATTLTAGQAIYSFDRTNSGISESGA